MPKSVENTTWSLDPPHAKLGFSTTHLMVSDVEGFFKVFQATVTAPNADFTDAVVTMSADVSSVSTDNDQRDTHLKSADFFDATKYPSIEFKSTSFKPRKVTGTYEVKGNLTIHGITKPITLTAFARTGTNPMSKKIIAGFKISGKINRSDFAIGASIPDMVVSDEINLTANVEFDKN